MEIIVCGIIGAAVGGPIGAIIGIIIGFICLASDSKYKNSKRTNNEQAESLKKFEEELNSVNLAEQLKKSREILELLQLFDEDQKPNAKNKHGQLCSKIESKDDDIDDQNIIKDNPPLSTQYQTNQIQEQELQSNDGLKIYFDSEEILDKYDIQYLFHMTHINNLAGIIKNGILPHDNPFVNTTIDNKTVNNRRAKRDPIYGRTIHSYVPFYFNPKNAMLFANKDIEENIAILAISRRLIYQDNTIFTDGNAASANTSFFNDLANLRFLDWHCLGNEYWHDYEDGKRKKMAEILIPKTVSNSSIIKIVCKTDHSKSAIEEILRRHETTIPVEIYKNYYFEHNKKYRIQHIEHAPCLDDLPF